MSTNYYFTRKILLVRHGRTDWNDAHRFQGRTDIPLNGVGLAQAEKVARRIEGWPVDAIYTSPLARARQTADAIAALNHKIPVVMDDLTEIAFGSWEGIYFRQCLEKRDESLLKWIADPFFQAPEEAENWSSIRQRAERAVNFVLDSGHRHVVMVCHGGIMRALLVAFLGFDPHTVWKIKSSNCSLTGIEVREHETSLAFANDEVHLREARQDGNSLVW